VPQPSEEACVQRNSTKQTDDESSGGSCRSGWFQAARSSDHGIIPTMSQTPDMFAAPSPSKNTSVLMTKTTVTVTTAM